MELVFRVPFNGMIIVTINNMRPAFCFPGGEGRKKTGAGGIEEAIVESPKTSRRKQIGLSLCIVLAAAVGRATCCPGTVYGGGAVLSAQDSAVSVASLIARYIQACGGPALAEVRSEKRRGTLVRGQNGRVPFVAVSQAPGKWHYNQVFAYGDQVSYGCDGETAWIQDTKGVGFVDETLRLDLEMLLDIHAPLRLREFFPEMSLKGVEKRNERETVVIKAKSRDGRDADLVFDKESGFLVEAGDLAFEDYRPVGNVQRPHRVSIGGDPGGLSLSLKMEITEIVHHEPAEDSMFRRPECALPPKSSPLYRPRRYVKADDEALRACVGIYQHPTNSALLYTVTKQQNHLMIERTGWGQALEIMPETEWDYSIRFLNYEFHFVRDSSGRVTALELGPERLVRAERIQ